MTAAHPPPHSSDAHQARRALPEMLQMATALSSAVNLPALLRQILSSSRDLTLSDAGSFYLVEEDKGEKRLWFTAFQNSTLAARGAGIDPGLLDVGFPITPERLVGWTALHGEVLNLPDVSAISPERPYRFDDGLDRRTGFRAVSMLLVPLRTMAGDVVGVMQLINRKREATALLTPEAVVEKATKLDAPGNRIHEIRTRFEVLLRDGRIAMLEGLLAGGDTEALQRDYGQLEQELQRLAGRTWWRHFDDRLGLGWEEQARRSGPSEPLPAPETLLSDAPLHGPRRRDRRGPPRNPRWSGLPEGADGGAAVDPGQDSGHRRHLRGAHRRRPPLQAGDAPVPVPGNPGRLAGSWSHRCGPV
ncbi:GAF domain-containing protein [Synechococcus sp. BA-132 BA5]|nr:GAF domain-containing protein [Synechococcus sp. BA-132 BA5]MEA5414830.1 GAF domain-containing protein [Synechococcus sp. BA-132 BA5]